MADNHQDDPRLRGLIDELTAMVKLCHGDELDFMRRNYAPYRANLAVQEITLTYTPYPPAGLNQS